MCSIPREMMLEIERDRELQELREDLAFYEADTDPASVRALQYIRHRMWDLEEAQQRGSSSPA